MKTHLPLVVVCAFLSQVGLASATDWLQFRGPGGLGVSTEKNLPTTWSAKSNVLWKTELPGAGSSSPIVVGNKIFLTTYSGHGDGRGQGDLAKLARHVVCLDLGGKILWQKEMPADQPE